jgi:hypothetical protein
MPGPWSYDQPAGDVPEGRTLKVALVACGKAKVKHPAPAREFYIGGLFTGTRDLVEHEAAGYDAWWILSARHYLVHPDAILTPYEAALGNAPKEYVEYQWPNQVDVRFRCTEPGYGKWSQHGGRLIVDIYAGQDYTTPLMKRWDGLSWEINLPLEGLQIGERLAALKHARENLAA